jgi:GNAT superfamily N-acetyltransferase
VRDDSGVQIVFRTVDAARPPASELLAAMVAEMNELYGDIEVPGMPSARPADFAPPAGTFLVGFHEEEPVCGGGIKRIAPDAAEIKRMYVVPAARGRRIGLAILTALEAEARRLGTGRLVLETGERQPESIALYRRAGFIAIPRFGEYVDSPLSFCMAKPLGPA